MCENCGKFVGNNYQYASDLVYLDLYIHSGEVGRTKGPYYKKLKNFFGLKYSELTGPGEIRIDPRDFKSRTLRTKMEKAFRRPSVVDFILSNYGKLVCEDCFNKAGIGHLNYRITDNRNYYFEIPFSASLDMAGFAFNTDIPGKKWQSQRDLFQKLAPTPEKIIPKILGSVKNLNEILSDPRFSEVQEFQYRDTEDYATPRKIAEDLLEQTNFESFRTKLIQELLVKVKKTESIQEDQNQTTYDYIFNDLGEIVIGITVPLEAKDKKNGIDFSSLKKVVAKNFPIQLFRNKMSDEGDVFYYFNYGFNYPLWLTKELSPEERNFAGIWYQKANLTLKNVDFDVDEKVLEVFITCNLDIENLSEV